MSTITIRFSYTFATLSPASNSNLELSSVYRYCAYQERKGMALKSWVQPDTRTCLSNATSQDYSMTKLKYGRSVLLPRFKKLKCHLDQLILNKMKGNFYKSEYKTTSGNKSHKN